MRSRNVLIKVICFLPLLITLYHINRQFTFQHALSSLYITLDDFPNNYSVALNASRTHGEPLLSFDYNASFPDPLIPRIIHFIYFADLYHRHDGTPSLPASSRSRAPALCRKFNPNFEIRTWNETEAHTFIQTEYPWFIPIYDSYKHPIQRVDALKYFVLYHYGGVYMDLDVACRRPLEPLLQFPAWFPEASPLGVNNDLMASMPQHPVLLNMTSALAGRNWNLLFPYLTIFWSTGPQFSSDILRSWWGVYGARMNGDDHDTATFRILPRTFYSEAYTFFGHSAGGTWHGGDVAMILWLVDKPWVVLYFLLGGLVLTLGVRKGLERRKAMHKHVAEDKCYEA